MTRDEYDEIMRQVEIVLDVYDDIVDTKDALTKLRMLLQKHITDL